MCAPRLAVETSDLNLKAAVILTDCDASKKAGDDQLRSYTLFKEHNSHRVHR